MKGDKVTGGYDDGYRACPCFWGKGPGSLILKLESHWIAWAGVTVLDAGCGEGKNSIYCARQGAEVTAVDVSLLALKNARISWDDFESVEWVCANVEDISIPSEKFDVVIMYGLLHCLASDQSVRHVVEKLQGATKACGFNVLCAFNSRAQDLTAHPGFRPTLLDHDTYLEFYRGWQILEESDSDLHEIHPHNNIPHAHSLTRIIARKGPKFNERT